MVCGLIGGETLAIQRSNETLFVHGRVKTPTASPQAIEFTRDILDNPIPRVLELALGMKMWSKDVDLEYFALHLQFIHRVTRMPGLDKPFNNFHAAGTNRRLDFSLSLGKFDNPAS